MILLRLLAVLLGGLLLLAPPLYLSADGPMRNPPDATTVALGCALVALLAGAFFYIAVYGHRMKRSKNLRIVGGALLAAPLITGVVMISATAALQSVYLSIAMFCLAAILFVSFVYPGERNRKHRPMRKRDIIEPYLETPSRF